MRLIGRYCLLAEPLCKQGKIQPPVGSFYIVLDVVAVHQFEWILTAAVLMTDTGLSWYRCGLIFQKKEVIQLLKKIMSGISWVISKVKAAYAWATSEETQAKAKALCTQIRETVMTISRKVVVTVQRMYLVKELVLEGLGGKENFKQVLAKVRAEVKALSNTQVSYAVVTV